MKWAAAGFWKEDCSIAYLNRPNDIVQEPQASLETKRCMHKSPSPRAKAHSVLLLLRYTDDPSKIDEYSVFLRSLKEGEAVTWGSNRHYLEGIEPVISVTHAPCLSGRNVTSGRKVPCTVDSKAVALFTKRLAYAADGDNAFLLAPESPDLCKTHEHGHLCSASDLNFLSPRQFVPILYALKAKAIARIKAMLDGR